MSNATVCLRHFGAPSSRLAIQWPAVAAYCSQLYTSTDVCTLVNPGSRNSCAASEHVWYICDVMQCIDLQKYSTNLPIRRQRLLATFWCEPCSRARHSLHTPHLGTELLHIHQHTSPRASAAVWVCGQGHCHSVAMGSADFDLSQDEVSLLSGISMFFSALSLCGSGFIILCYLRFRSLRTFAFKLVRDDSCIAVGTCVFGCAGLCFLWAMICRCSCCPSTTFSTKWETSCSLHLQKCFAHAHKMMLPDSALYRYRTTPLCVGV